MSPVDTETPTEPLTRMLAAIRASQSKAQYTCKRYERGEEGEGKREREKKKRGRTREKKKRESGNEREREQKRKNERVNENEHAQYGRSYGMSWEA